VTFRPLKYIHCLLIYFFLSSLFNDDDSAANVHPVRWDGIGRHLSARADNKMERVATLLRIQKVPRSNLDPTNRYPEVSRDFPHFSK
jgi:hypothetical protein